MCQRERVRERQPIRDRENERVRQRESGCVEEKEKVIENELMN